MEPDIYFMPLGGGQRVGASCYYLQLGECNLILDAGTGKEKGLTFEPDLHSLVTMPFLQSAGQIHQIYISHAYADHIGYLPELTSKARMAEVYMTELISCILALGCICDQRTHGSEIKTQVFREMLDTIEGLESFYSVLKAMSCGSARKVAVKMIKGEVLSGEEEKFLLTKLER